MINKDKNAAGWQIAWRGLDGFRPIASITLLFVLLDTALASLGVGLVLPVFQAIIQPESPISFWTYFFPDWNHFAVETRTYIAIVSVLVVFLGKAIIAFCKSWLTNTLLNRLRFHWVNQMGKILLLGPIENSASRKYGEVLNDWLNESLAASRYYKSLFMYISSLGLVSSLVIFGLLVNWQVTGGITLLALCAFAISKISIFRSSMDLSLRKLKLAQTLNSVVAEQLSGVKDVKLLAAEKTGLAHISSVSDDLSKVLVRGAIISELPSILGEFIAVLGVVVFIAVSLAIFSISPVEIIPILAFFFIAFYRLTIGVSKMISSRTKSLNESHSLRHILDLLGTSQNREELEEGSDINEIKQDIRFRNVSFSYSDTDRLLNEVSLSIPKGQTTLLVGPSGSGKSTILNCFMRFSTPHDGDILVNGRSIEEFNLRSWRTLFAYIDQEPLLFNGTILENIRLGNPNATFEEIREACRLSGAEAFICELPDQYDTHIDDRGGNISGGQIKRLAIARALIRKPKLLILDEATSAFETKIENEIIEGLRKKMPDITVVIVSHRLQVSPAFDWVIILEQGRVSKQCRAQDIQDKDFFSMT